MTRPSELTATEARRLIGLRRLSPVELLDSCIQRIEAVNPALNAIVTVDYDAARDQAQRAEAAVMRGESLGALHGLPSLIKDLNDTRGLRTTYGSPTYKSHVPAEDDPVVGRMRAQGAIIVGKTNTPEFGVGSNTTNRLFGPTGNPFNPTLTSGGSSGGAGAALATGMAPIANGSDSGCSIRNPAAFNGVVGLRPTPGVVPSTKRVIGLTTNGVQGPMGRTVEDTALLLSAIAGYDPRDMLSHPLDPTPFATLRSLDLSGLRVAISEDLGFAPVDPAVRATFRRKLERWSGVVSVCDEYPVGMTNGELAYWGMRGLYLLAGARKHYLRDPSGVDVNLRDNIEDAQSQTTVSMAEALAEQTRIYQSFQAIFETYDVLVTPAVNVLPFPHATPYPKMLDGRPALHYAEWYSIAYGISLVGHPALSIPAGLDEQGTPFGLQVVGPRFGDHRLLEIGAALEAFFATDTDLRRPLPDIEALSKAPRLVTAAPTTSA